MEPRPVGPGQGGGLSPGAPRRGAGAAGARRGTLIALDHKGEPLADRAGGLSGLKGLVALDGNWAQAKALWWRNACLTRLRRLGVVPDGPSLYANLPREARPQDLSTLGAAGLPFWLREGN